MKILWKAKQPLIQEKFPLINLYMCVVLIFNVLNENKEIDGDEVFE